LVRHGVTFYNLSYSGGKDQEDGVLRSAQENVTETPSQQTYQAWWFIRIIQATSKAESRGSKLEGSPGQKYQKNN
jgi:hypothetical protein